ncbi:uncharacterized protein C2845_PM05G19880 [Panicum miliaceum]|uniref:Uncharacterized protein n=1 Tax=Panicum miliaceum TaxID=4540 RepID=A0A3L6STA8_PANMI|nr:uncharacterized protein C2845_PM05G19880 [Panicum miliaceum]
MTDAQWCQLVDKWSNAHHRHQNKSNNAKPTEVTEDAELQVTEDAEPTEVDAVVAFKFCHTSSKNGMSAMARDAVMLMETIQAEPVANGQSRLPSAEVVSKPLSQASSNNTFLKNAVTLDIPIYVVM